MLQIAAGPSNVEPDLFDYTRQRGEIEAVLLNMKLVGKRKN